MGIYFSTSRGIGHDDGNYKVLKIFRFGKLIKKLYSFGKKIYEASNRKKYYCTWNIKPSITGTRIWIEGQERPSATYEYIPVGGNSSTWIANGVVKERTNQGVSYTHGINYKVEAPGYKTHVGWNGRDELNQRPRENKVIDVPVEMEIISEYKIYLVLANPPEEDLPNLKITYQKAEKKVLNGKETYFLLHEYFDETPDGTRKWYAWCPTGSYVNIIVSADGYNTYQTSPPSEGFFPYSYTPSILVDQQKTITVTLSKKSDKPTATSYTKTLTYSPSISATVTSSNPNIKIERPSGDAGSAMLTAPAGTVGNVFVTPTVAGYASYTFNDVAFNDSLGLSCTLTSTVVCRCYTFYDSSIKKNIYVYIYPSTQYREQVYVASNNQATGGKVVTELAVNRAGSTADLTPAWALRVAPQGAVIYPEVLVEMNDNQATTASNYAINSPKLYILWNRFREGDLVT